MYKKNKSNVLVYWIYFMCIKIKYSKFINVFTKKAEPGLTQLSPIGALDGIPLILSLPRWLCQMIRAAEIHVNGLLSWWVYSLLGPTLTTSGLLGPVLLKIPLLARLPMLSKRISNWLLSLSASSRHNPTSRGLRLLIVWSTGDTSVVCSHQRVLGSPDNSHCPPLVSSTQVPLAEAIKGKQSAMRDGRVR